MAQMCFRFDWTRSIAGLIPYQGKGARNGRAKLSDDEVRRIRRMDPETGRYVEKASALSQELDVCEKTISLIRRRLRWGHVND